VFANIPAGFKRSDVEYTHGELIGWGPNRTYVRHVVDFGAPGTREFLFAPSKIPIAFLISLDHRLDRLSDSVLCSSPSTVSQCSSDVSFHRRNDTLDYFEGKLRILRVSAKHHVGFSNGDGISTQCVIVTRQLRAHWLHIAERESEWHVAHSCPHVCDGALRLSVCDRARRRRHT